MSDDHPTCESIQAEYVSASAPSSCATAGGVGAWALAPHSGAYFLFVLDGARRTTSTTKVRALAPNLPSRARSKHWHTGRTRHACAALSPPRLLRLTISLLPAQ